jgi:hypothetical protein
MMAIRTSVRSLDLHPFAWKQVYSLLCRIFDGEPEPLHLKMQLSAAAFSTANRNHFT